MQNHARWYLDSKHIDIPVYNQSPGTIPALLTILNHFLLRVQIESGEGVMWNSSVSWRES